MIIAHLRYIPTLKAWAATCFSWYNIATPHLHHTLTLRDWSPVASHKHLNPLVSSHALGLLPLVKHVLFKESLCGQPWIAPTIFGSRRMQHFRALVNLQDLTVADLDFSRFPAGTGKYFGHFSPTLRSVTLIWPRGTHQHLLGFLRLFPNLDDIRIYHYHARVEAHDRLGTQFIPIGGGLQGQLILRNFDEEELLKAITATFGGMRFTSLGLENVRGVPLLLEACADTLETVHIYPYDRFHHGEVVPDPREDSPTTRGDVTLPAFPQHFDFSRNTALRSLEIGVDPFVFSSEYTSTIKQLLSTIASPAFSEIIITFPEGRHLPALLGEALRELYKIRDFRAVFCLETLEELRLPNLQRLTSEARVAAAEGAFDFLPCPPLIFSREVTRYHHSMNWFLLRNME